MDKQNTNQKFNTVLLDELFSNSFFDVNSYSLLEQSLRQAADNDPLDNQEAIITDLVTTRNRNCITREQQQILSGTVVGFFGLSVGSHAALTWMMEARAKYIKISDPDTISATNLNRLRVGVEEIGKTKVETFSQQLTSINPFTRVISTTKTDAKSIERMFDDQPKVNIIVDAIDDLAGKVLLRKLSKARRIPLLQFTDVGDNVIIDIERYDRNPQPEFFLGRVPNIEKYNLSNLSETERIKLILQIVGLEECSEALLESLLSIGKTIATWPQLGATATIAGGVATTVIKKLVLGEDITSKRYVLSLDNLLLTDTNSERKQTLIKQIYERFNIR